MAAKGQTGATSFVMAPEQVPQSEESESGAPEGGAGDDPSSAAASPAMRTDPLQVPSLPPRTSFGRPAPQAQSGLPFSSAPRASAATATQPTSAGPPVSGQAKAAPATIPSAVQAPTSLPPWNGVAMPPPVLRATLTSLSGGSSAQGTLPSGQPPLAPRTRPTSNGPHSSSNGGAGGSSSPRGSISLLTFPVSDSASTGSHGRRPTSDRLSVTSLPAEGSGNVARLGRRHTTNVLATTVQNFLERREEPDLGTNGLPLYELVKASRRLKSQRKCLEGTVFFVFMLVFALLVTGLRQTSIAAESTETLQDLFLSEEFTLVPVGDLAGEVPFFRKSYLDIKTQEEWWLWAFGPLLRGLYFGEEVTIPGDLALRGMRLPQNFSQLFVLGGDAGGVLLRTARIKGRKCEPSSIPLEQQCYPAWGNSRTFASEDPFGVDVDPLVAEAFTFREDSVADSYLMGTFLGRFLLGKNNYGKNGYHIDLPANNFNNRSVESLVALFFGDWLDVQTRAVSVEFNVYNPETKIITVARFFTEIAQTGMVRPSYRFYHINAMMWGAGSHAGAFYQVIAALFLLLLVVFTVRWVYRFASAPKPIAFLFRAKVVFDLLMFVLFWVCTVWVVLLTCNSNVIREAAFKQVIERQVFTASIFDDAVSYHDIDALCSINLMLATVKLVGYMPFKTTRTIWTTLGGAVKDIFVLGIVVVLFWFGFAIGSHLTFGSLGFFEFNRIDRTFGTLMVLMFSGAVDFNAMREVSFLSAPVFYAVYMIFMWGVMLNLFVAIIVLAYERYSDVQQNFDNWAKQYHRTEHGSIVMLIHEALYHRFYRFALEARRSLFYASESSDLRRKRFAVARPDSGQVEVESDSALQESMQMVLDQREPAARRRLAISLGLPFRDLFRSTVQRVIWIQQVERTRVFLETCYEEHEPDSTFIAKWRKEFDYEKGTARGAYSIRDATRALRCCGRDLLTRSRGSTFDEDEAAKGSSNHHPRSATAPAAEALRQTFSHAPSNSAISQTAEARRQKRRFRTALMLNDTIERETTVYQAKVVLEAVLAETQALFKNHRISFNRILRLTWNKTTDQERLKKVSEEELRELLSPGCKEERRPCSVCTQANVEGRVRRLLDSYATLVQSQVPPRAVTRRIPKYRRIPGVPNPFQRDIFDDEEDDLAALEPSSPAPSHAAA